MSVHVALVFVIDDVQQGAETLLRPHRKASGDSSVDWTVMSEIVASAPKKLSQQVDLTKGKDLGAVCREDGAD